jgi:hypothetical protein
MVHRFEAQHDGRGKEGQRLALGGQVERLHVRVVCQQLLQQLLHLHARNMLSETHTSLMELTYRVSRGGQWTLHPGDPDQCQYKSQETPALACAPSRRAF